MKQKQKKRLKARLRAIDRHLAQKEKKKARKWQKTFSELYWAERLCRIGTGEYTVIDWGVPCKTDAPTP